MTDTPKQARPVQMVVSQLCWVLAFLLGLTIIFVMYAFAPLIAGIGLYQTAKPNPRVRTARITGLFNWLSIFTCIAFIVYLERWMTDNHDEFGFAGFGQMIMVSMIPLHIWAIRAARRVIRTSTNQ